MEEQYYNNETIIRQQKVLSELKKVLKNSSYIPFDYGICSETIDRVANILGINKRYKINLITFRTENPCYVEITTLDENNQLVGTYSSLPNYEDFNQRGLLYRITEEELINILNCFEHLICWLKIY